MDDKIYTVAEAAERLKVSTCSIYRAVESGQLSCMRVGRQIRLSDEDLNAYLRPDEKPEPQRRVHCPVYRL